MSRSEAGQGRREGCCPAYEAGIGAAEPELERNRYFTGKHMRARDFAADTRYLLDRHRLHNRLLHGWGIVCGLEVRHHPDKDCRNDWIEIEPGLAIDCYGREIVLSQKVRWKLPFDQYTKKERRRPFLVGVRFCEQQIELVRVLYAEDGCDPLHAEANRLRDAFEVTTSPVHRRCWATDHDRNDERDEDKDENEDKDEDENEDQTAVEIEVEVEKADELRHEDRHDDRHDDDRLCFAPDCPCDDLVPLARIVPLEEKRGYEVDPGGRRYLPAPASRLTRIEHINWPHGGTVTSAYIDNVMRRRLCVTFSHPLQRPPERLSDEEWAAQWADGRHNERHEATGINEMTLGVQFVQMSQALEFLPGRRRVAKGGRQAVFEMDRRPTESIVYVTLLCDFILDRHGLPVDGNFLRGRLPTGNGAPGGAFQSWFRVVPEEGWRSY